MVDRKMYKKTSPAWHQNNNHVTNKINHHPTILTSFIIINIIWHNMN